MSCSRSHTESRAIPTRRVLLSDASQLPHDYCTTPGGTFFSTTPGGTRIIYDRKFLMECRNSPLARTPPPLLPHIPGVTNPRKSSPTAVVNAANAAASAAASAAAASPNAGGQQAATPTASPTKAVAENNVANHSDKPGEDAQFEMDI
ncbi:eukaryotic translation initiation factor 4E-binding protein 2-like [Lethenteron reissneri]|uniref:eukaryotic translation initiation factor 4E-binding protein 2-like n=1 Tax=Lethenteron reissneri TaxID=7753 RepID=UPI002AB79249|nr:eukaryotic translation initiation factor 4E-binding protein 2-like [Lethenteron reissneri]XP_061427474.1 eukaryotic translation initiation factor 4E-binding protein 2-like [Lethenteron reissneri]